MLDEAACRNIPGGECETITRILKSDELALLLLCRWMSDRDRVYLLRVAEVLAGSQQSIDNPGV